MWRTCSERSRYPAEMRPRPGTLAAVCASTVGSITLGWLFGLPELTALAVAGATVALLCLAQLHRGPAVPEVDATVTPPVTTRGLAARLTLRFSNTAGTQSRPVRISGRLGGAGTVSLAVGPLPPAGSTTVEFTVATPRRGVFRFGTVDVHSTDPLRLWRRETSQPLGALLVVRPRIHPLAGYFGGGGMRVGAGEPTATLQGGSEADVDLVGLRPYVPGDDLRRIHWRTSARRNEPHVVQVEPPASPAPVIVVLDTRATACGPERFEFAVEAAASICSAAVDAGRPFRLTTTAEDARRSSGTSTRLGDALDMLSALGQGHAGDVASVLLGTDRSDAHVVVCSGDPTVVSDAAVVAAGATVICWDGSTPLHQAVANPLAASSAGGMEP